MPFDINNLDWVSIAVAIGVLVVAWVILKAVLRLTMRIFTVGCAALLLLTACTVVLSWIPR